MDKIISQDTQRKSKLKSSLSAVLILGGVAAIFFIFRNSIQAKVTPNDLIIATASEGDIQQTITASGTVVPQFETVITSPISSEIQKVILKTGNQVKPNQSILKLNKEEYLLQYEQMKTELEIKQNKISQFELQTEKDIKDLVLNKKIGELNIEELNAKYNVRSQLLSTGDESSGVVRESHNNLKIKKLEQEKTNNQIQFLQASKESSLNDLHLEVKIQKNKIKELERKLRLADIKSKTKGVIVWLNENIGTKIAEGESLARIANLEQFKIEAICSDNYAQNIKIGGEVIVKINQKRIKGFITNILPSAEGNTIKFIVELEEKDEALRPNLRVEIFIITSAKEMAIKLPNGPTFNGGVQQDIFVIQGNMAYKRTVSIGLSNINEVEILDNLQEGESVILSDMRDYKHLDKIPVIQ